MSSWSVSTELTSKEEDIVFRWISQDSYWANGIPRAVFERSLANSLCFALRDRDQTLRGFARTVTDSATFAYLADVFIDPSERGKGAGHFLIESIVNHPNLQNLRLWLLATKDAHPLYARYGFEALPDPSVIMARNDPDIYARLGTDAT